jgi:hypothetical protein
MMKIRRCIGGKGCFCEFERWRPRERSSLLCAGIGLRRRRAERKGMVRGRDHVPIRNDEVAGRQVGDYMDE